jgi:hypothetical protein
MSTISLLCSHFGLSGWVLKISFKKYKRYYFNMFLNKKYFKNTVTNTAYESSTYWNTFCGLWLKGSRWWPARLVWCLIQGARDDHHYSHHYCLHVRSGVNFNLIPLDGVFGRWSVHPVQSVWAALLHKGCTHNTYVWNIHAFGMNTCLSGIGQQRGLLEKSCPRPHPPSQFSFFIFGLQDYLLRVNFHILVLRLIIN